MDRPSPQRSHLRRFGFLTLVLAAAACGRAPQVEWTDREGDAAPLNISDPKSPRLDIVQASATTGGGELQLTLRFRPPVRHFSTYRSEEGRAFGTIAGVFLIDRSSAAASGEARFPATIEMQLGFASPEGEAVVGDRSVAANQTGKPLGRAFIRTGGRDSHVSLKARGHVLRARIPYANLGWTPGERVRIRFRERADRYGDSGLSETKRLFVE